MRRRFRPTLGGSVLQKGESSNVSSTGQELSSASQPTRRSRIKPKVGIISTNRNNGSLQISKDSPKQGHLEPQVLTTVNSSTEDRVNQATAAVADVENVDGRLSRHALSDTRHIGGIVPRDSTSVHASSQNGTSTVAQLSEGCSIDKTGVKNYNANPAGEDVTQPPETVRHDKDPTRANNGIENGENSISEKNAFSQGRGQLENLSRQLTRRPRIRPRAAVSSTVRPGLSTVCKTTTVCNRENNQTPIQCLPSLNGNDTCEKNNQSETQSPLRTTRSLLEDSISSTQGNFELNKQAKACLGKDALESANNVMDGGVVRELPYETQGDRLVNEMQAMPSSNDKVNLCCEETIEITDVDLNLECATDVHTTTGNACTQVVLTLGKNTLDDGEEPGVSCLPITSFTSEIVTGDSIPEQTMSSCDNAGQSYTLLQEDRHTESLVPVIDVSQNIFAQLANSHDLLNPQIASFQREGCDVAAVFNVLENQTIREVASDMLPELITSEANISCENLQAPAPGRLVTKRQRRKPKSKHLQLTNQQPTTALDISAIPIASNIEIEPDMCDIDPSLVDHPVLELPVDLIEEACQNPPKATGSLGSARQRFQKTPGTVKLVLSRKRDEGSQSTRTSDATTDQESANSSNRGNRCLEGMTKKRKVLPNTQVRRKAGKSHQSDSVAPNCGLSSANERPQGIEPLSCDKPVDTTDTSEHTARVFPDLPNNLETELEVTTREASNVEEERASCEISTCLEKNDASEKDGETEENTSEEHAIVLNLGSDVQAYSPPAVRMIEANAEYDHSISKQDSCILQSVEDRSLDVTEGMTEVIGDTVELLDDVVECPQCPESLPCLMTVGDKATEEQSTNLLKKQPGTLENSLAKESSSTGENVTLNQIPGPEEHLLISTHKGRKAQQRKGKIRGKVVEKADTRGTINDKEGSSTQPVSNGEVSNSQDNMNYGSDAAVVSKERPVLTGHRELTENNVRHQGQSRTAVQDTGGVNAIPTVAELSTPGVLSHSAEDSLGRSNEEANTRKRRKAAVKPKIPTKRTRKSATQEPVDKGTGGEMDEGETATIQDGETRTDSTPQKPNSSKRKATRASISKKTPKTKQKRGKINARTVDGVVNIAKMRISDMITYNPPTNPMTSNDEQTLGIFLHTSSQPNRQTETVLPVNEDQPDGSADDAERPAVIAPRVTIDADGNIVLDEERLSRLSCFHGQPEGNFRLTSFKIYNILQYKSHRDQVVFYLSGADITRRTSLNINNLPECKSHRDRLITFIYVQY